MSRIQAIGVTVKDHTGDNDAYMRLPTRRTIGQVRPRILDRLALPTEEDSGEPITYSFYNESTASKPYLEDGQIVGDVLADGQTMRIVPEITAGRI